MPFDYEALQKSWKWDVPGYFNIGRDCADKYAKRESHADRVALYFEDGGGKKTTYTFSQISALTNRIGNALLSLGFTKGDRIIIRLPNLAEYPLVFLGAVKIGAVPIPTSSMLTTEEVGFIVQDSSAKGVVTTPALYEEVEPHRAAPNRLGCVMMLGAPVPKDCVDFTGLIGRSRAGLEMEKTTAEDVAYICYTSGTSGFPKGVVHAQRAIIGRDPAARFWQALKPGDTVMHAGKLNWTYTLGAGCLDPWRRGCSVVLWGGEHDPGKFLELIERYGVNVFMAVPTVYRQMLRASDCVSADLSSLRHALSAGEHLSEELFYAVRERMGVELYDGLGMTEFSYYLSNMPGMPIKPGSPGKPQPGHKSALLDEEGREVRRGEVGVLATPADDPGIMLGYLNLPDDTRSRYKDGWFISGDYFYEDDEGYYWIQGRKDDLITTFGYRVSPHEVERALLNHPKVHECAVAGIEVGDDKTITAAFVVLDGPVHSPDEVKRSLLEFSESRLAYYKRPKEIYFLESIPKTPNGKIRRKVLREEYSRADMG